MIAITIFTLFALYTITCCMDGPDLKPRWKRWFGIKLKGYADRLFPIDYCVLDKCKFFNIATHDFPLLKMQHENLVHNIAVMDALNYKPIIYMQNFDAVPVESRIMLSEGDIYKAQMYQDIFMIEEAKEKCVRNLLNEARQFASVVVDEESHWPGIIITAKMLVGKNRNS